MAEQLEPTENPFWDFSLQVYRRPGFGLACIDLQDRHGVNVNLLIYCNWAGSLGRVLTAEEIVRLVEITEPWQEEVVRPLRASRRAVKTQQMLPPDKVEMFRQSILACELKGEELEQLALSKALPMNSGEGSPEIAAANLRLYLADREIEPSGDDTANLAAILSGCFPEIKPLQAVQYFVR